MTSKDTDIINSLTKEDIKKSFEEFWEENKMKFSVKITDVGNGMIEVKTNSSYGSFPKIIGNDII